MIEKVINIYYCSTRGKAASVKSAETIIKGLAPDGGLYIPAEEGIPFATGSMPSGAYHQLAKSIFALFLSDYSETEIDNALGMAYNADNFDHPKITPLQELANKLYIMELWHGPTYAFKDIALQVLPHLMKLAIKKTGEKSEIVVLTATSGDTGKSALEGFRDIPGTRIAVFFPEDGVSRVQRLQMTTQEGANVSVAAVRGNFDDAQSGVKKIFNDQDLAHKLAGSGYRLSSANSINWGRLLPQIVYYFAAYNDLVDRKAVKPGDPVIFAVPTGNFGNILAGYYARQLGLPVKRLICAANRNNVLSDFINSGTYNSNRQLYQTTSPSMDILVSSNLERLLFSLNGRDPELLALWMKDLNDSGQYRVDRETFNKLGEIFWSDYADDHKTALAIADTYRDYGYLIDTHTAVAKAVLDKYLATEQESCPAVILSTASPFKFTGSVMKALHGENHFDKGSESKLLERLARETGLAVPTNLAALKGKPIRHKQVISREAISDHLLSFLKLSIE